jgi:DNA-binding transcriptional regulator GbsR (MarR family)
METAAAHTEASIAPAATSLARVPQPALSAVEAEMIEFFVRLAHMAGVPKSVGEIYGLLFVSLEPLSFDQIMERLDISKGSVSQGLKFLRTLGAVRTTYVPGDRRDRFVAETELRKLMSGLLREQIAPHLASGEERLSRIGKLMNTVPPARRDELKSRVGKLKAWHSKARMLLPLIQKVVRE